MLKFQLVAVFLTAGTLGSPAWQGPTQGASRGLTTPPIVAATDAPAAIPEIPPLGSGDYPETVQFVDALVQATRVL